MYYLEKEKKFTYVTPEYQNLIFKYMADSILRNIVLDIKSVCWTSTYAILMAALFYFLLV